VGVVPSDRRLRLAGLMEAARCTKEPVFDMRDRIPEVTKDCRFFNLTVSGACAAGSAGGGEGGFTIAGGDVGVEK
jgi:hypothetical protein